MVFFVPRSTDFGLARILGDKSSKEKSEEGETKTVGGFHIQTFDEKTQG